MGREGGGGRRRCESTASSKSETEDDSDTEEAPQSNLEGFWLSRRGKVVHKAVSKDKPVAACGYVFRMDAATWVASLEGLEDLKLCRRSCCFKTAIIE